MYWYVALGAAVGGVARYALTGFLQQLCAAVHARVYCVTAAHFQRYLNHPPPGVS